MLEVKAHIPVSERIKKARQTKGCTIREVAEACGVTESAVQMYECGLRTPRDSIKIKMADFFGESVQNLFF